ncbi:MAG: single-stranded DNA-binding protein [Candidatus Glassbacteria bacterium]
MANRGLNKVMLIGNLGADPDFRATPSGTSVATFNVATTEMWTNREGQQEQRTEWHRIVTWGRLAEVSRDYLKKGKQVYIEGRLQTRSWEDRDGQKRYTTEVVANQMLMLGRISPEEAEVKEVGQPEPFPLKNGDELPF